MVEYNTYLKYKRDQRHLVYWITHTSAQIIKKLPSDAPELANTTITGAVSLATLKSRSKLIAKHIHPISHAIFHLLESVIKARKETHGLFCKLTGSNPDPEVQKSNESHLHWINGLVEVFNILGGDLWRHETKLSNVPDEDEGQIIFTNTFTMLSLDSDKKGEADKDAHSSDSDARNDPPEIRDSDNKPRSKRKPAKGGKENTKGRRRETKGKTSRIRMLIKLGNMS